MAETILSEDPNHSEAANFLDSMHPEPSAPRRPTAMIGSHTESETGVPLLQDTPYPTEVRNGVSQQQQQQQQPDNPHSTNPQTTNSSETTYNEYGEVQEDGTKKRTVVSSSERKETSRKYYHGVRTSSREGHPSIGAVSGDSQTGPSMVHVRREQQPTPMSPSDSYTVRMRPPLAEGMGKPMTVVPISTIGQSEPSPKRYTSEVYRPGIPMQLQGEFGAFHTQGVDEFRDIRSTSDGVRMEEMTKEQLYEYTSLLLTDLKDARDLTRTLSNELQSIRRKLDTSMNRSQQLEVTSRSLTERVREYKQVNKSLTRSIQERDNTIAHLQQSGLPDAHIDRFVGNIEKEHNKLLHDYGVLHQSYNRKEQQLHGFYTERAELLRKLDLVEREKVQLWRQLNGQSRSSRTSKYGTTGRLRDERIHSQYENRTSTVSRHSSLGLAPNTPRTIPTAPSMEDNTYAMPSDVINPTNVRTTNMPPGWVVPDDTREENVKPITETSDPSVASHGDVPHQEGAEDYDDETTLGAHAPAGMPSDKPGRNDAVTTNQSPTRRSIPVVYGTVEVPINQRVTLRSLTPRGRAGTDSDDVLPYPSPVNTRRQWREVSEPLIPLPWDQSAVRAPRYLRPLSAYGYSPTRHSTLDREIYQSPLPRRSTTSFSRLHPTEQLYRAPELEFFHPSSRRSSSRPMYTSDMPRSAPPTRSDLNFITDELARLKKEKKYVEKQFYANQAMHHRRRSYSKTDLLSESLNRLNHEIRALQSRLNSGRYHRHGNN